MRQVRWGVLGLAVVVMTATSVWSMRGAALEESIPPPGPHGDRALAELEQELKALRAELASLRQEQDHRAQGVDAARAAPPPSPEAGPAPTEPGARPDAAARASAEQAHRERLAELDAELEAAAATEPRDMQWAGRTEAQLGEAFRLPELTGSHLARVDCRSRLCVLEVEHDRPEARLELLGSLRRASGLRGQAVLRPSGDGSRLASRVYLSREGARLPLTLRR
ncbi:hypothetical protein [Pyxidicoccus sp. MSG2]|uniref:hypothetical protein n=1 Tax=Pyxidicoccus sp. MSG2 TaxID=2996790 RepID=UPI00226E7DA1|nr:hypothetical protein [Pyxidicoccus sp. MSG2]MCY1019297.1 hypothetical protein [Pyxidicoccus sp. MSG2]